MRSRSAGVVGASGCVTRRWTTRGMKLARPLMAPVLPRLPISGRSGSKPTYTVRSFMKASARPTECAVLQALSLMPRMVVGYIFFSVAITWCDRLTPLTCGMWYR